mgnify:CR=1 FL=1
MSNGNRYLNFKDLLFCILRKIFYSSAVMSNFIINFWYGKFTLWKSYWLIGELINSLVLILIYNIEIRLLDNIKLYKQIPFLYFTDFSLISKIALFFWTIFITVGIWRSAEAYKGKFIWIVLTLILLSYRIFTLRVILY